MKHIVYIGNKLSNKRKTATTIDTLGKQLEASGYKVTYASRIKPIVFRFLDMLLTVFKHRKTADYVLIDTYSTLNYFYAYYVSRLCQVLGLKYIPILHGGDLPKRLERSPKTAQRLFGNAYINIAPSQYLWTHFKAKGYTKLSYIPNTIQIRDYEYKKPNFDTIKLLWVRSFSKFYNPNLAIALLKTLRESGFKANLCMIGPDNDGSLAEAKALAKTLELDVEFTGKMSKNAWHRKAADYNIFLNTTSIDNTPVSVIEAMALGLPVVSTNVGGIPFLINHNKDGILTDEISADAFKKAVVYLFENKGFAYDVARAARHKVENFDWDIVKQKWFSVLS